MPAFRAATAVALLSSVAYALPQGTTTYACNPAHSYPNGASCVSSGTGLTLITPSPSAATTYACNPAHSYPNGASCISSGTGLTLVTPAPAAQTTYACNPAHSYPNGASCVSSGTGLTLVTPAPSAATTYACNPAHSYPNGASCVSSGTGLTLVAPAPSSAQATYTCNPAHSYPNGAKCISSGTGLTLVTPTPSPVQQNVEAATTITIHNTVMETITSCSCTASSKTTLVTSATPAPTSSSKCPLDLVKGTYEYPHLLEINGVNGYFGRVDRASNTSLTFDIPSSDAGKTCNTYFLLPAKATLETSDYNLTMSNGAKISVDNAAGKTVAQFAPVADNKYLVESQACPAGGQVKYGMSTKDSGSLSWFNDWNPCALGMFITIS